MTEPLKLGIAGLGTVGAGLMHLLEVHGPRLADNAGRPIKVMAVSARTGSMIPSSSRPIRQSMSLWN